MKTMAIIQARMSSSRFPGKHLMKLAGKPMIDHVTMRVSESIVGSAVVATSDDQSDDELVRHLDSKMYSTAHFRGSLTDPLLRAYRAAVLYSADIIVRITADCPLVDSRTISTLLGEFASSEYDYIGSTNSPDGNDVEVFSFTALCKASEYAQPHEREHTTTWIRKNMACKSVELDPRYADVHYSVNTPEDMKTCELLIQRAGEGAKWQDYVAAYRELRG